jgi:hypothetical protein
MSSNLPESDWRLFTKIHNKLLEQYCEQILEDVRTASRSAASSSHDRYRKVYDLIHQRDKQMANAFDDFRRSTAVMQLAVMRRMKLLTDEDLGKFSEQTRIRIEQIASL